jgi:hypothetical protein
VVGDIAFERCELDAPCESATPGDEVQDNSSAAEDPMDEMDTEVEVAPVEPAAESTHEAADAADGSDRAKSSRQREDDAMDDDVEPDESTSAFYAVVTGNRAKEDPLCVRLF